MENKTLHFNLWPWWLCFMEGWSQATPFEIFDWLEKYPKLRIGLDYESFTFDEFSKCDKEVVELTQPIEEVTAHIETKDNYGYALLEDIPSLYGEPVDEYRTTDNDLHVQMPLFLLVSVIIPTKISLLKFLQNLAKLSPKRICL